jgi:hypothetical protein
MSSTTEEMKREQADSPAVSDKMVIVEFDGGDDKWDPKNFSSYKKWVVLTFVMHGAVVVTCASSMYVSPIHCRVTLDIMLQAIGG